jgi:hypothetical protein
MTIRVCLWIFRVLEGLRVNFNVKALICSAVRWQQSYQISVTNRLRHKPSTTIRKISLMPLDAGVNMKNFFASPAVTRLKTVMRLEYIIKSALFCRQASTDITRTIEIKCQMCESQRHGSKFFCCFMLFRAPQWAQCGFHRQRRKFLLEVAADILLRRVINQRGNMYEGAKLASYGDFHNSFLVLFINKTWTRVPRQFNLPD